MPDTREAPTVNKEALNALVDLYYLYSDIATHLRDSRESANELDLFFTEPGSLRELLIKYYDLANLDAEEAGKNVGSLTIEMMLPRDNSISFYKAHDDLWQQIIDVNADLKGYNRDQDAVSTQVPEEVQKVVRQGREIIATREKRSRSGADVAVVHLGSAVVAYENHTLHIDSILIPLESNSLMDLATDYMCNQKVKGEQADTVVISTWIDENGVGPREPGSRAIKDACRAVNELVKEKLVTAEDFFDTSARHRVIRRY